MLNDAEAITLASRGFGRCFPKICGYCGRRFDSLRAYVMETRQRGVVVSVDSEGAVWESEPLDALAYATCQCGNTLAIGTEFMEATDRLALLAWVHHECETRGVRPTVVWNNLRVKLQEVLSEPLS